LADSGLKPEAISEIERKVKILDVWAVKLNPSGEMVRYDALALASEWAKASGWIPRGSLGWGAMAPQPTTGEVAPAQDHGSLTTDRNDVAQKLEQSQQSENPKADVDDKGGIDGSALVKPWRDVEEWGASGVD
jgi:hypothetical protein